MSELRGRVISGLRWQASAKLGSQLVSWAATVLVMRLLAPADYGLMAMTMVVVGFVALIAEMGLGSALVQSSQVDLEQQRNVFGLALLVNGTLYAALAALSPLSATVFDEPRLVLMTIVLGLQLPLAAVTVVPEAMARRELRFKALSLIELATQLMAVIGTVVAAWLGAGAWALVAGHLTSSLVKCMAVLAMFGTPLPRFDFGSQRRIVKFGGSLTVNRIVWYFFTQFDTFVAAKLLGPQALGTYSVAVSLANMPMQKIMSISNQVAFSAFAKLQGDPPARNAALIRGAASVFTITLGLLWGLAGTAPDLIPLLLGSKWTSVVVPLQIIAVAVPLRTVAAMLSTALVAAGFVNEDLKNTLTGAAILGPAFVAGALTAGVTGLAVAWALGFLVFGLTLLRRASRRLGLSMRALAERLRMPLGAGVLMVGTIVLVRAQLTGLLPTAALLTAEILAGGAVYVLLLYFLDRNAVAEITAVFRSPSTQSKA